MDKRAKNELPKECLFINANYEIMKIEFGKTGFRRSELSTENKKANQEIVDSYNVRHGITKEQVEIMHRGALIGWNILLHHLLYKESAMKNKPIFQIEVARHGEHRVLGTSDVSLPATPYELADAMDKARITDEEASYSLEILECRLDYLPQFIIPDTNIYELNHLAQRLASFDEWQMDCFEGLNMMDTIKTGHGPIEVSRLINMTHSIEDCQIIYEANDDHALGRFYADNDFVPHLEDLKDEIYEKLDFGKIGKEMREDENGVFTPHGYVVLSGELAQIYQKGDAIPLEKPDYTVLLEITRELLNDTQHDSEPPAILKLPAADEEIHLTAIKAGASSIRECSLRALDCSIPLLRDKINEYLSETDGGGYELVDKVASALQKLADTGQLSTCKAMLDSVKEYISLENVLDVMNSASEFRLLSELSYPDDYARAELAKSNIPLKEELLKNQTLFHYGKSLMEHNKAVCTEYGILYSPSGCTVEQCITCPDYQMEIRGQE